MRALLKRLKQIREDLSGNILVMVGAGTAALVGSAGIGVDAVQWYLWKRQMQQTVDSGSMAGALSIHRGEDWEAGANLAMSKTTNTDQFADVDVERLVNPPATGDWAGDDLAVEIIATTSKKLPFSSVFMDDPAVIRVRSVAVAIGEGEHCVVSLRPSGTGINIGGSSDIDLGCGVAANSQSSAAVEIDGSSLLNANPISAVGGVSYGDSNVVGNPSVQPYSAPIGDPLAERNLSPPSDPAACDERNYRVRNNQNVTIGPTGGATAMRFCGGLTIQGTAQLRPGIYIVDGGDLNIGANADISGSDVTIIMTGDSRSDVGAVDINARAAVDISAPSDPTSDWDGILIYQDQIGSNSESNINGSADINLNGIIYMPNSDMRMNGTAGMNTDCLMLIGYTLTFLGSYELDNDWTNCPFDPDSVNNENKIIRVVE